MYANKIEITDGILIPWWLWVCNLGYHGDRVTGNGIEFVYLSRTDDQEALFEFVQADNTRQYVFIGQVRRYGSTQVIVRVVESIAGATEQRTLLPMLQRASAASEHTAATLGASPANGINGLGFSHIAALK